MNIPFVVDLQPHILKNLESDEGLDILSKDPDFDPHQVAEIVEISLALPSAPMEVSKRVREGWQCLAFIRYNEDTGNRITVCMGLMKT